MNSCQVKIDIRDAARFSTRHILPGALKGSRNAVQNINNLGFDGDRAAAERMRQDGRGKRERLPGDTNGANGLRRSRGRADRVRSRKSDPALAFLARLATEFTAVLDLPDLITRIMRILREETGFDSCSLALANERDPEALVVRAASGIRAAYLGLNLPAGKGLDGAVMTTGRPLMVADMASDRRAYRQDPSIRSGIYAPLTVEGRVTGILSAHRSMPSGFTQADLDMLTVVARYIAGAIEVARLHDQLKDLAAKDPLTGLANRRVFLDRLAGELARARRRGEPLTIALLDLDGFKEINDAYGHAIGDAALRAAAKALVRGIRTSDLAARFGGDEFTLMLPDSTQAQAVKVLERSGLRQVPWEGAPGKPVLLHFSWGTASCPEDGEDANILLQAADARLYAMKKGTFPPGGGDGASPEPTGGTA